jgi:hypothetical protein
LSNSISPESELRSDTDWTTLLTTIKGRCSNPAQVSAPGRDSHGLPTETPIDAAFLVQGIAPASP